MKLSKVLITGGEGFIGSYLAHKLVNNGYHVSILDNSFRGKKENLVSLSNNIVLYDGDIRNREPISNIISDVDIAFHFAAINGTRFFYEIPQLVLEVNLKGTINFLEAVRKSKVGHVIFASSSEVYGFPTYFPTDETHRLQIMDVTNPRFSYAGSKIAGELLVINYARTYGFDYTIVRYHNVYGPKMGYEHVIPQFIKRLISGEDFIVYGDGNESRSFCYISDAVDGTLLTIECQKGKNQIFNIGNNEETKVKDLIKMLSKISGKEIKPKYTQETEFLRGSTKRRLPDISKANKLLGYSPKVRLEEGLKLTYDWYRKELTNLVK